MAAAVGKKFKLAAIQLAVGNDKLLNVQRAIAKIGEAVSNGANVVVLPECFNSPYGTQYFQPYSEKIPGPTTDSLAEAVKRHQIYLIGGSLPETDEGKLYNTCPIYNRAGDLLAKFRKLHLFDIDVPGKIRFKESEALTAGATPIILDSEYCKIGIGICYDVRFGELARLYANLGCQLLVYPSAFNMTTGPAHWELLARSRALDQASYFCFCSPARDTSAGYVAYGHSMIVDPWGIVLAEADEKETIIYADIDTTRTDEVRGMIPISNQRRKDIYDTIALKEPLIVK